MGRAADLSLATKVISRADAIGEGEVLIGVFLVRIAVRIRRRRAEGRESEYERRGGDAYFHVAIVLPGGFSEPPRILPVAEGE